MLDPKLQDGKKIPKWHARARRGQFLGMSIAHSSTVGPIRNLRTQRVSPQFHVVYDELFETIANLCDNEADPVWVRLYCSTRDAYVDIDELEDVIRWAHTRHEYWTDEDEEFYVKQSLADPDLWLRDAGN